jgi:hypothetical protein
MENFMATDFENQCWHSQEAKYLNKPRFAYRSASMSRDSQVQDTHKIHKACPDLAQYTLALISRPMLPAHS